MRLLGIITLKTPNCHVEDLTISCSITAILGTPLCLSFLLVQWASRKIYIFHFKKFCLFIFTCVFIVVKVI